MDLFEKLRNNLGPIGSPAREFNGHHYFAFPKLEGELGPHMRFQGKDVLNWSLNNYLGPGQSSGGSQSRCRSVGAVGTGLPNGCPDDVGE